MIFEEYQMPFNYSQVDVTKFWMLYAVIKRMIMLYPGSDGFRQLIHGSLIVLFEYQILVFHNII
jgi:hypothetical protein